MFKVTLPQRLQAALPGGPSGYGLVLRLTVWGVGVWILSGLLWAFALPAPAPWTLQLERPQDAARQLASLSLQAGSLGAVASAGPATHDLHLMGVLHSDRGMGARVILRQDGAARPLVLALGEEVAAGLRVSRIETQQITLSGAGRDVVLALPRPTQAPETPEPGAESEK